MWPKVMNHDALLSCINPRKAGWGGKFAPPMFFANIFAFLLILKCGQNLFLESPVPDTKGTSMEKSTIFSWSM